MRIVLILNLKNGKYFEKNGQKVFKIKPLHNVRVFIFNMKKNLIWIKNK